MDDALAHTGAPLLQLDHRPLCTCERHEQGDQWNDLASAFSCFGGYAHAANG